MKDKLFIVFTDLDGTFTPISVEILNRLVKLVDSIQKESGVKVKFCPISGRNSNYVMGVMNVVDGIFSSSGIKGIVDIGAGEQGGILVDKRYGYKHLVLSNLDYKKIDKQVKKLILKGKYKDYFVFEPGRKSSTFVSIKEELMDVFSEKEIRAMIADLKKDIQNEFAGKVHVDSYRSCFEVAPVGVAKELAFKKIMSDYSKQYNIVGLSYAGDGENDLSVMRYISKISLVPGIKTHIVIPSNRFETLTEERVNSWNKKLKDVSKSVVTLSDKKYFEGVIDVLEERYNSNKLFGSGLNRSTTYDELDAYMDKKHDKNRTMKIKCTQKDQGKNKTKIIGLE